MDVRYVYIVVVLTSALILGMGVLDARNVTGQVYLGSIQGIQKGTLTCADGSTSDVQLTFETEVSNKGIEGSFEVTDESGSTEGGTIDSGTVRSDTFEFSGSMLSDDICGDSQPPAEFVLDGNCGADSEVSLNTASGQKGSFRSGSLQCAISIAG